MTQTRNSDTFLCNTGPIKALDDPNRNFYQTYTLTRIENGQTVLTAGPMLTMPDNVGPASTPSYGGNGSGIYEYTEASGGKGRVFAGPDRRCVLPRSQRVRSALWRQPVGGRR